MAQRRLRVCFFIPDFGYGGAQKQCILLLNELQTRDDVELMLIRFRPGAQAHILRTDRLRDEYVTVRSNFDVRAILAARRLVADFDANILISWVRVCDVYAYFVQRLCRRTKWVMTQRNSQQDNSLLFQLRDRLGQTADAVASNSPGGVQRWIDRNIRGSVHLVDNIAAPSLIPSAKRVAKSVLFVGRLEPQKNVITMIEAFVRVARSQPEVQIWVCGDGTQRTDMETIVTDAGVAGQIQFLGFRTDATEWMSRAQVLVSLSDYEGMPNVLMEGVQAGCTIVASPIIEHVDFLGTNYPYLIPDHHDAAQVSDVVQRALASPIGSDELQTAREHLARMHPANVAEQYMRVFRSLTVSGPVTTPRN